MNKFQYKLKENALNLNSIYPVADYLKSLGITKVSSFLGCPEPVDELSPWLLNNMERCVQVLHDGFIQHKHFFLQVDSDVDGYTSSSIFYRFFKDYYPYANITWRLHDGKEHGVVLSTVPEDADIIVLPDSGSMQLVEQQTLAAQGKQVIIMDHHNVTEVYEHENVILVNNQNSEQFTNKDLSGAGVVFKVIQAYSSRYPHLTAKAVNYYDLAALGILSDMMDVRSLDNNYIIYKGLRNILNPMFQALLHKQEYSISSTTNPTKIDVVFYISPLINGVIRAGTEEEKETLFRGFIKEPLVDTVQSTWRGQERNEDYYSYAARIAYNSKSRQNSTKEKCFNFLCDKIRGEGLDKNKIIVVVASKEDKVVVPQNITGLIAMDLLKEFGKPVLVLRPKTENNELFYAGSGRGKIADGFTSFLQFVRDSKYSEYGEGHAMAFGASIAAKNLDAFIAESNERLADVNFNSEFVEVDAIFNERNINLEVIYQFAKHKQLYGNSIPQPKFAIEANCYNITLMGKDASSIKLTIGNLPCIKFKDAELAAALKQHKGIKVTLVGRPELNEFMGRETGQLFIENIYFEPIQTKTLF